MRRILSISLISLLLYGSAFAQFDFSPYTYEKHLISNSLAAQTGDNTYGLAFNLNKYYTYLGLWTSLFLNNNFGLTFNTFDNYFPPYYNINNTNLGGFYRNDKKNIAYGVNFHINSTYLPSSDQFYFDLSFSPSLAYFTKKFTLAAQLSYIPMYSNDTAGKFFDKLLQKTMLTVYSDFRVSNLIQSYSFQPSVLLGLNYYQAVIASGFNSLIFRNLLLGAGTSVNVYYSDFSLYFYPWLQGGLKVKDNYYFYLKLHAFFLSLTGINLDNFNLLFSFKYHIPKHENSVPRYF